MAKIKIVPVASAYSGVFQGAECGLLRLSLTYRPGGKKPVAPGLALKVLRDGVYSANISALVNLQGQEDDYNFFKHPMSNIVPRVDKLGQKLVHRVFKKVSPYPEELKVEDMARIDSSGKEVKTLTAPRQLFFVPAPVSVSSAEHDVRKDFLAIPVGTAIYQIHALSSKHEGFDYTQYKDEGVEKFIKDSEHIADIVTTSEFLASEFGDQGIFFRHQTRLK
jgi:hypothetical protein